MLVHLNFFVLAVVLFQITSAAIQPRAPTGHKSLYVEKPEPPKLPEFIKEKGIEVADLVEFAHLLNTASEPQPGAQSQRVEQVKTKLFGELKPDKQDPENYSEEDMLLAPPSEEEEETEVQVEAPVEQATSGAEEHSGWDALKVCITFGVIFISSLVVLAVGFFIASKKEGGALKQNAEKKP